MYVVLKEVRREHGYSELDLKMVVMAGMVAHMFNPSAQEAEG